MPPTPMIDAAKRALVPVRSSFDLAALDTAVNELSALSLRPLTWETYLRWFQQLTDFLAPKDVWKATPRDIARWFVHLYKSGRKPKSIEGAKCAINFCYERLGKGYAVGHMGVATRKSPARGEIVLRTFKGIRRANGAPPQAKLALLLDSIEKMIDAMPDTIHGRRDSALILLGWAAALRQSELVGLDLGPGGTGDGWVEIRDDGVVVTLRRSKTNMQYEVEERYAVPARPTAPNYCPVRLLRRWISAAQINDGPLFRVIGYGKKVAKPKRLNPHEVRLYVKAAGKRIGIDETTISSQSLRAGCVTWLALEGVSPLLIQQHTGHRRIESVMHYFRPLINPANSPLNHTRWIR